MKRLAALVVLALPAWAANKPAAALPNIVLISIDTLRADHLSVYGYPRATSPALASFARECVLFERAISQSPRTASSHMTLFTGVYPSVHGVVNWREKGEQHLSDDIPTLATLLKRAGYRTAAYTAGGNVRGGLGFDQGFDSYVTQRDAGLLLGPLALPELQKPGTSGRRAPFFLFLHSYELHDPYTPEPEYEALFADPGYAGRILSARETLVAEAGSDQWDRMHDAFWRRVDKRSPADVKRLGDLYDAGIRRMDDRLAAFLARFRELGLEDDTLLVFLSDHGEAFGEHQTFTHESVYEEALHVPLLLRLPGATNAGRRVTDVVRLVDVMPTLLELAGQRAPAHLQGSSLVPLFTGGDARARYVFSEWAQFQQQAFRSGRFKYVRRKEQEELYDLEADPAELRNLATTASDELYALRGKAERLSGACRELHARFAPGRPAPIDEETRRELGALGYVATQ